MASRLRGKEHVEYWIPLATHERPFKVHFLDVEVTCTNPLPPRCRSSAVRPYRSVCALVLTVGSHCSARVVPFCCRGTLRCVHARCSSERVQWLSDADSAIATMPLTTRLLTAGLRRRK